MKKSKSKPTDITISESRYKELLSTEIKHKNLYSGFETFEKHEFADRTVYKKRNPYPGNTAWEIHVTKDGYIITALIVGEDPFPKTVRPWKVPIKLLMDILEDQGWYQCGVDIEYAEVEND